MGARTFRSALVADQATVVTGLLCRFLEPRCARVEAVLDGLALRERLRTGAVPELVVVDIDLPGGGGLALLEELETFDGEKPAVVLLSTRPDHSEETQASLAGAIGYVAKPIRLPELDRTLALAGLTGQRPRTTSRLRSQPVATAQLLDQGAPVFALDVLDISETGALVTTHAPLEPGTALDLSISLDRADWLPVRAEVVRVQKPDWSTTPGVGIRFVNADPSFRAAIRQRSGEVDGD